LDRFGVPSSKAIYPADASDEDKRKALEAAVALRNESAVALPAGFDVTLIEAAGKGAGDFSGFLAYWDDAIAKVILSQTGTSKIGQYSGTAEVHNEVRYEVLKSDGDLLCETFNAGPAKWLTEWNFPGAALPKIWRRIENRQKVKAEQERDKTLYDLGLELSDDALQNRFAGEWQRRAAPAVPTLPGTGPEFAETRRAKPKAYPEMLAEQLDALTMDAQTAQVDRLRELMDQVLATGGDLNAFAEKLLDAYPLPGVETMGETLAGALAAAKLAGMAGVED
jgi:phage gp29-like protein